MNVLCPCCGQPIIAHRAPLEALVAAPLGPTARTIVNTLSRAYPRAVQTNDLVDAVYASASGGPIDAAKCVRDAIATARKSIEPFGWTIPKSKGGHGAHGFKLEPVKP